MFSTIHNWSRLLFALMAMACSGMSRGASVVLDLMATDAQLISDAVYNDGESIMVSTTKGGIATTFRGVNYGDDPTSPDQWGLIDASRPWNRGRAGLMLRGGYAPDAVGSTQSSFRVGGTTGTTQASYLSIVLQNSSQTMFSGVQITLKATTMAVSSNTWGGTSADGFSTAFTPTKDAGKSLTWDFTNLDFVGSGPLEIRIYGLAGGDTADLSSLSIKVTTAQIPIPEPATTGLLVFGLMVGLAGRRRRSRAA